LKTIISDGLACRLPVSIGKGGLGRTRTWKIDFTEEGGTETSRVVSHRNGNLSWSVFNFFVFVRDISINEDSVTGCKYSSFHNVLRVINVCNHGEHYETSCITGMSN